MPVKVRFFRSRRELRTWFESHHRSAPELWVGFYKAHTGRGGAQYDDAVEEALCFGWIDTTVRRIDDERYTNRFTPRRPGSRWSRVNRERFRALERAGRVTAAGHAAFARADPVHRPYSYEARPRTLSRPLRERLHSNPAAWAFFRAQAPGYRRLAAFWVMSARRVQTRERRLAALIDASERGRRPGSFQVAARPTRRRKPVRAPSTGRRPR